MAIVAGTVLPYLNQLDQRLLANEAPIEDEDDDDEEMTRVRELLRQWKAEAAREGKPLKLPTMPFMLRNIWTASLALFALVMLSTFWITTVWQATIAISLLGVSWACAVWVPFAIIMQVRTGSFPLLLGSSLLIAIVSLLVVPPRVGDFRRSSATSGSFQCRCSTYSPTCFIDAWAALRHPSTTERTYRVDQEAFADGDWWTRYE